MILTINEPNCCNKTAVGTSPFTPALKKWSAILKPDIVIVTTTDRYHHEYIIKALEMDCDVITEKPMTIDEEKCNAILEAEKRTKRNVTVTFNMRFAPLIMRIKEILKQDTIGQILSVHFEWFLDTSHGADYFRRWHRRKENSGGLLIHKSTHHFDVVNWFWKKSLWKLRPLARCGFTDRPGRNAASAA